MMMMMMMMADAHLYVLTMKRGQATCAEDYSQREQISRGCKTGDQRAAATSGERFARRQVCFAGFVI